MSSERGIRVVGLGDPVCDILAHVSFDYLATITDEPGGCVSVKAEEMAALLKALNGVSTLTRVHGGSAANVMKGLANLLGPRVHASFLGMVGQDATGEAFARHLSTQGVHAMLLQSSSGAPSAVALCLVTPDGQRTMRTCLGASLEFKDAAEAPIGWSDGLRLLHCEGYCLYRPDLTRAMMTAAKSSGATVSLDLASFELVRNCKAVLVSLLESGLVDVVFANHEEAAEMAKDLGLAPEGADFDTLVAAAQDFLLLHINVSVVSEGPQGCRIRDKLGNTARAPADDVKVVDTIGAGDSFSSGVLAALLTGAPLSSAARLGCDVGAAAVCVSGCELPAHTWATLRAKADILMTPPLPATTTPPGSGSDDAAAAALEASPSCPRAGVASMCTGLGAWADQLWRAVCGKGGLPERAPGAHLAAAALPLAFIGTACVAVAVGVRARRA